MVSTGLLINAREAADFLAVAGSPHRLLILAHLLNGEMSVNVLLKRLDISQASLSTYLGQLRRLGLVDTRRDSQWICYSCNSQAVRELFSMLEAFYGAAGAQDEMRPVIAAV